MNSQDVDYLGTHLLLDAWTIHTTYGDSNHISVLIL
nr:MAG TPA: hypothetical protein [Bacteriophage sp.]